MFTRDNSTNSCQPRLGFGQGARSSPPPYFLRFCRHIGLAKVSESEDMEEAAAAIHRDDVQLCRRLGQVFHDCDHFDSADIHDGNNIHIILTTIMIMMIIRRAQAC